MILLGKLKTGCNLTLKHSQIYLISKSYLSYHYSTYFSRTFHKVLTFLSHFYIFIYFHSFFSSYCFNTNSPSSYQSLLTKLPVLKSTRFFLKQWMVVLHMHFNITFTTITYHSSFGYFIFQSFLSFVIISITSFEYSKCIQAVSPSFTAASISCIS